MGASLKDMNPFVECSTLPVSTRPVDLTSTHLKDYSLVVLFSASWPEIESVSRAAREASTPFIWGCTLGGAGVVFNDLGVHHYVDERPKEGGDAQENETYTVQGEIIYRSLWDTLSTPLNRRGRRDKPMYAVLRACYRAYTESGVDMGPAAAPVVKQVRDAMCAEENIPLDRIPDATIDTMLLAPKDVSAVCTVVGGVVGNEVIRAVSGKGLPMDNIFLYNLHDGWGKIEKHPL